MSGQGSSDRGCRGGRGTDDCGGGLRRRIINYLRCHWIVRRKKNCVLMMGYG